jgi:hypothetical protein
VRVCGSGKPYFSSVDRHHTSDRQKVLAGQSGACNRSVSSVIHSVVSLSLSLSGNFSVRVFNQRSASHDRVAFNLTDRPTAVSTFNTWT